MTFRGASTDSQQLAKRNIVSAATGEIGLTGRIDFNTVRDLRNYGLNNPLGIITGSAERDRVFGTNIGMEREREMQTGINFTPQISAWIKPRVDIGSSYNMLRDRECIELPPRLSDTTQAVTFRFDSVALKRPPPALIARSASCGEAASR